MAENSDSDYLHPEQKARQRIDIQDIVRIVREEFGKGNDVIAKITYKASGGTKPRT